MVPLQPIGLDLTSTVASPTYTTHVVTTSQLAVPPPDVNGVAGSSDSFAPSYALTSLAVEGINLALLEFYFLVRKPALFVPSLAGPNEAGELLIRSNATVLGYKGNVKATRETFVDGWLRTGDQIRIDDDGVLL
ncbi:hypothetical protein AZE42_12002 [Rhizopogon vesiculosus]|uniref:Uncharacterized protein n=1 Tax=Rhizopogon vesiculosus TaxID=180088 RepID=A0A1J8PTD9_9AGAM|nr:hypothetical protein AZE42_12002 [Rhizopogon vesiculosus]